MSKRTFLAAGAGVLAVGCLVVGATAQQQSNFGTVSLRAGFLPDPHSVNGTSGGDIQASTFAGGSCQGWVTRRPDHILQMQSASPGLRVTATSSSDTTLVIQTPGGQFLCNDDANGRNPAIVQGFPAGTYRIWIGSYARGENAQYTLAFTERGVPSSGGGATAGSGGTAAGTRVCGQSLRGRPVCVDANAPRANFGCRGRTKECALRTGFTPDPWAFRLTAGGGRDPINVETLGLRDSATNQACSRSFITPRPDFRFSFAAGTQFPLLRFYVQTQNGADATLLVNTPDARWRCNDDSHGGLMPTIDFNNPQPGRYDVWVGTYDGSRRNRAQFFVTELDSNHP
jgi:hypothetical protein